MLIVVSEKSGESFPKYSLQPIEFTYDFPFPTSRRQLLQRGRRDTKGEVRLGPDCMH